MTKQTSGVQPLIALVILGSVVVLCFSRSILIKPSTTTHIEYIPIMQTPAKFEVGNRVRFREGRLNTADYYIVEGIDWKVDYRHEGHWWYTIRVDWLRNVREDYLTLAPVTPQGD